MDVGPSGGRPYTPHEASDLARLLGGDEEQMALDGVACLHCGGMYGRMLPVGEGPRGEVFAHEEGDCDNA